MERTPEKDALARQWSYWRVAKDRAQQRSDRLMSFARPGIYVQWGVLILNIAIGHGALSVGIIVYTLVLAVPILASIAYVGRVFYCMKKMEKTAAEFSKTR